MAVAVTVTLPAQPASGSNEYIPLGGDGWTAPHSVAEFSVGSAGAAGGGNNVITVNFDPRFQSIVSYLRLSNSSASGGIEMDMRLLPSLPRSTPQLQGFANAVPVNGLLTTNNVTWSPPPIPGLGRIIATTTNVDGDTLSLMGYIYQFQITVLQRVPLNLILASLPRGDNMVTTMPSVA